MDTPCAEISHLQREEVTAFRFNYSATFAVLCKMHLSFVLDLDKDEFSPFLEAEGTKNKRKRLHIYRKGKVAKEVADGTPLTIEFADPIRHLIRHLQKSSNIQEEGLFRKSGSVSRQQALKILLSRNVMLDFEEDGYSVHDCACTLKNMLSDLKEPLLTNAHFAAYCRIPGLYREKALPSIRMQCHQRQLKAAQLLLLLLPTANYNVVKDLLLLLHGVSRARKENCMSSNSLATLFTPIILCPRQMSPDQMHTNYVNITRPVTFLIENAPLLFEYPEELVKDVISYIHQDRRVEETMADKATEPVKTTITFCVQQNNAEPVESYTEKALAELYSYVQGMPETMQKRSYIRRLNKENNCPSPIFKRRKHERSRTLGGGIKELSMKASLGCYKHNDLSRSTSTDNIKVLGAISGKEKVAVTLSSPWRFLRRMHDESSGSYDASPAVLVKPEGRKGTPIRNTVLRASRRLKNAIKTHKHGTVQEVP